MTDYPPFVKFFVLLALISCFFVGCSDSEPKLNGVESFVIFDYENNDSSPNVKLSVFAQTESDAHRVSRIVISSKANNYEWTVTSPLIIEGSKKQWVGYTDFACPREEKIPTGFYNIKYFDGEERSFESSFLISYDEKLMKFNCLETVELLKEKSTEQIAIYDENDILLYLGLKKTDWNNDKIIFSSYKDVLYYRICLFEKGTSAIVMLPKVYKNDDKGE